MVSLKMLYIPTMKSTSLEGLVVSVLKLSLPNDVTTPIIPCY